MITRVELVRSQVSGEEVEALRQPGIGWAWQEATGAEAFAVPEGRVAFLCKGPRYTAALSRSPAGHEKVWLFAPDGGCLGLAADYGTEGLLVGRMGWNAEGTVLGVLTVTREGTDEVETWRSVDLVAADTRVRHRLANLDLGGGHLGWLGEDLLVWGYTSWGTMVFLEVDGATGVKHVLHRRLLWPEGHLIEKVVARPKGRYLAVNLIHYGHNAWEELWILDRETGWFGRATYETGMSDHFALRWESEDRLLFLRANRAERRIDLCRAYLEPPPNGARIGRSRAVNQPRAERESSSPPARRSAER